MRKYLSILLFAFFIVLLASCGKQYPKLTLYFYNSEAVNVYVVTADLEEYKMKKSKRDSWYEFTFSVLSLEEPDFNIYFKYDEEHSKTFYVENSVDVYFTINDAFSSFEDAEDSLKEDLTPPDSDPKPLDFKIYFYNSDNWEDVYLYAWIELDDETSVEPLGKWPGVLTTSDGSNWYYIEVSFDLDEDALGVVFSDGYDRQTEDVVITSKSAVYVTLNDLGSPYLNKEDAEAGIVVEKPVEYDDSVNVYYHNANEWEDVYLYAWIELDDETSVEPLGKWPGTLTDLDSDNWYKLVVPFLSDLPFGIVFNDGDDNKSNDIEIDNKTNVYINSLGLKFSSKAEALEEVETPELDETTTIYYYNDQEWDNVYAYAWTEVVGLPNPLYLLEGFPGTKMEPLLDEEGWFSIELEYNSELLFEVVFSSGEKPDPQIPHDKTDNILFDNVEKVYYYLDKWYETTEEIEFPIEVEIPEFDKTTTIYYYNDQEWDNVYAYAWYYDLDQDYDFLFAGIWPGTKMEPLLDEEGWFSIELEYNSELLFEVVFSSGEKPDPQIPHDKTDNILFDNVEKVYYYLDKWYEATEEIEFPIEIEIPEFDKTTTIYYYNDQEWDNVYAYAWYYDLDQDYDFLFAGIWPGTKMEPLLDEEGWFSIELEYNSELLFEVVFSSGEKPDPQIPHDKTDNILFDNVEKVYYYLDKWYETTEEIEFPIEIEIPEFDKTTTIHFYNMFGWDEVYAHAWNNIEGLEDPLYPLLAFPGTKMNEVPGKEGWFSIEVNYVEELLFEIMFHNNETFIEDVKDKSLDLSYDGELNYVFNNEWYESIEDINSTTIYFYNDQEWEDVYLYTWNTIIEKEGEVEGLSYEHLGKYPGLLMEVDLDGWYKLEVSYLIDDSFELVANNGKTLNQVVPDDQTRDILFDDISKTYLFRGNWYESKDDINLLTLYYYNDQLYDEVYIYAWIDSGDIGVPEDRLLGDWPGTKMIYDKDGWYKIILNHEEETTFEVIFNNGREEPNNKQSDSFLFDNQSKVYLYLKIWYESIDEIPSTYVYFYNKDKWEEVYAYAWGVNDSKLLASWPGVETIKEEDDWFRVKVLFDLTDANFNIIFNNNNNNLKTEDIVIENSTNVYVVFGSEEAFSSKEAVLDFLN